MTTETIVTDLKTGGQKCSKLCRLDLIPIEPWQEVPYCASYQYSLDHEAIRDFAESATDLWDLPNDGETPEEYEVSKQQCLRTMISAAIYFVAKDLELTATDWNQHMMGVPVKVLWALGEHYGNGALKKYEPNNWRKGYAWSLTQAAMLRHLAQWCMGEKYDTIDTWCMHSTSILWHSFALYEFMIRGLGTDDRWVAPAK